MVLAAFFMDECPFLLEGLRLLEVSLFSIIFSFLIGGLTGVIRFANIPFSVQNPWYCDRYRTKSSIIIDHFLHLFCFASDWHPDEHLRLLLQH